jgi:hypothetical protein
MLKNTHGWSITPGPLDERGDRYYVIQNRSFNGNDYLFGILTESSDWRLILRLGIWCPAIQSGCRICSKK